MQKQRRYGSNFVDHERETFVIALDDDEDVKAGSSAAGRGDFCKRLR